METQLASHPQSGLSLQVVTEAYLDMKNGRESHIPHVLFWFTGRSLQLPMLHFHKQQIHVNKWFVGSATFAYI